MRGVLLFKSKLAALLVGMTAAIAIPVVGAIAIAYTILPDIGVFSSWQKAIVWGYGILCLLAVLYSYITTWTFINEVWREYLPGFKRMRYYIGLILLPIIGSFFMLYLYFKPSFEVGGTVKRCCSILLTTTIVDVVVITMLFFGKAGLEWILLVAGIMSVFHYALLITMACKLAKDPIGRPAKIIISVLLISLFGAVAFMASSTWIIDSKIAKARKELANIYGRPMTGEALKELYYHGLEPNYNKFKKIYPQDPEDKECFLPLPEVPEELTCFYMYSLTSKKLNKQLEEWEKSKQAFLKDFDRIIDNEKYLKMPKSIRNYEEDALINIAMPPLNSIRHWARVAKIRIKNALIKNDTVKALLIFKQFERIRDYVLDDHFLISYLVAIAVESIRFSALEFIIEHGDLSKQQTMGIMKYLNDSKADWDKYYSIAMYSNAIVDLDAVQYCANAMDSYMYYERFNKFLESYLLNNGYLDSDKPFNKFLIAPAHWGNYREVLYALNFLKEQAKLAPSSPIIEKALNDIPKDMFICKMVFSDRSKVWGKTQMIKNHNTIAVTALRIELYRKKYNKLPDELSDLIPEFATQVPIDLISDKPLKYIHGEITLLLTDARVKYSVMDDKVPVKVNGYRIYSVGFNKKDDNGFQGHIQNKYYDDIGFSVIDEVVTSKVSGKARTLASFKK